MNKNLILVAQDTINTLNRGVYVNYQGQEIDIKNTMDFSITNSKLYNPTFNVDISKKHNNIITNTEVNITLETTLQAGMRVIKEGFKNVCILNFASALYPGGGFLNGSVAQEECLARESGMYNCIKQFDEMYKYNSSLRNSLYSDYMIYSPFVPFFKDDKYDLLDNPILLSIITAPAVNKGAIRNIDLSRVDEVMEQRIEKIFKVAIENEVEVLILGAFGCGVFGNNPVDVCRYFNKAMDKYKQYFKKIEYPIYDRTPNKENYTAFNQFIKK